MRRRSISGWWPIRLSVLIPFVVVGVFSSMFDVLADPLDEVTGMGRWQRESVDDPEGEREDWLRDRESWRAALRELQLERGRNIRLGRFIQPSHPQRRRPTGIHSKRKARGAAEVAKPRGYTGPSRTIQAKPPWPGAAADEPSRVETVE